METMVLLHFAILSRCRLLSGHRSGASGDEVPCRPDRVSPGFRLLATVGVVGLFVWYLLPLTLANNQQPARLYQYFVPPLFFALILANCDDDGSLINRLLSSSSLSS